MKKKIKQIRAASKRSKLVGLAVFVCAFAAIGGLVVLRSRAAAGLCSTANVLGTSTVNVTAPETAQYRLWVRMQVPDATNTNNLNGVRVELAGASNQCFTVTTTATNAVNQWQWINYDATAASTPHVTASLPAGNYTAKILGTRAGVKVDKVILLRSDSTCVPSNDFTNGSPGDNCTTPAPTVNISANPTSVVSGNTTTLTWSSTNATSCTSSGGWTGSRATSGTFTTSALTTNQTFTLTCTGVGGSGNASVNVTVTAPPAPTVTLSANPTQVVSGSASTLTWSSTNATGCTASGGWSGARATSGSVSTGNLTANQTYNLSCTGPGGTGTATPVTVTVTTTPPPVDTTPPTVTMTLPGVTFTPGQTAPVLVRNLKSITWQPLASDASGIRTLTLTVNGQTVTLTNGNYVFGNGTTDTTRNGDYALRAVAVDNNNNTTTVNLTIQLRHPDFNRSGRVDISDVGALMQRWMQASTVYDLNVSGQVNISDVGFLMQNWLSTQ